MGERIVYVLFTDTGTLLSKTINFFTRQQLNHVSVSFDGQLREVYSFGRKHTSNPFIGGFVKEDVRGKLLKKSPCEIYQISVTNKEYNLMYQRLKEIEANQNTYKYNFLGLFGVLLQVELNRSNAFFCSQFIASLLKDINHISFQKPVCFIKPEDIRGLDAMTLIYQGILEDYDIIDVTEEKQVVKVEHNLLVIYLSKKLKRFVLK